jgi:hypothetical protein
LSFKSERAFDPAKLEDFLGAIVNIYGPRMLRYKGVLNMKGTERKVIFQGVHQLMGSDLGPRWVAGERMSKMVFIGIDLPTSWCRGSSRVWSDEDVLVFGLGGSMFVSILQLMTLPFGKPVQSRPGPEPLSGTSQKTSR